MRYYKSVISFLIAFLFIQHAIAQNNTNTFLRSVYNQLQKAKDYTVDAHIKVDMPFVRMLPVNAKFYFKQKDKFKVECKGIAIVPRQGFDQASKMLADTNSFTTIVQGEEKIGTIQTRIVNVIPLSDTSDMILGKFWIDPIRSVIIKSQLTTRSSGTILTEYSYGKEIMYGLPDEMIFSVDVKKFKVPKGFVSEPIKSNTVKDSEGNGDKRGKIYIKLSNYQINKGILDSVFKK